MYIIFEFFDSCFWCLSIIGQLSSMMMMMINDDYVIWRIACRTTLIVSALPILLISLLFYSIKFVTANRFLFLYVEPGQTVAHIGTIFYWQNKVFCCYRNTVIANGRLYYYGRSFVGRLERSTYLFCVSRYNRYVSEIQKRLLWLVPERARVQSLDAVLDVLNRETLEGCIRSG